MDILIVEDDEAKRMQLVAFAHQELNASVTEARSLQGGLKALIGNSFDLIFLDMTMPTYDITPTEDGGRPQSYAGRELLGQMVRRNILTKVIMVTQFDRFGHAGDEITLIELDNHLRNTYSKNYLGAVFYSLTYTGWQEDLRILLGEFKYLLK